MLKWKKKRRKKKSFKIKRINHLTLFRRLWWHIQRHAPTLKPATALFSITWRFIRQPKISNLETSSLLKPTRLERWVFALNKVDAINLGKDQGRPDKNANATFKKKVKDYRDYLKDFFFFQSRIISEFYAAHVWKKNKNYNNGKFKIKWDI